MIRAATRFFTLLALPALLPLACSSTTAAPVITSFSASPATIGVSHSTTLSWAVTGAATLSIDQGVGVVTGTSVSVTPTQTVRYTLTATNDGGVSTATTTVTVSQGTAQIASFTATPSTISAGLGATLAWTASGFASLSIDNNVGDVTALTQTTVSPLVDTTYTLTARDATDLTVSKSVTVSVHPVGAGIYYSDPSPSQAGAAQIVLVKNAASTAARAIIDVKTGSAGVASAFGLALNLPLSHSLATFNASTGILVPANPVLDPGPAGPGRLAAGAVGVTGGPLSDVFTLGFARVKTAAAGGNIALPANTVLFSIAFDLAVGAPAQTIFDGTVALPATAKLAVLSLAANSATTQVAVAQSGFAVGRLYTVAP